MAPIGKFSLIISSFLNRPQVDMIEVRYSINWCFVGVTLVLFDLRAATPSLQFALCSILISLKALLLVAQQAGMGIVVVAEVSTLVNRRVSVCWFGFCTGG
jgi:hypothetical protein